MSAHRPRRLLALLTFAAGALALLGCNSSAPAEQAEPRATATSTARPEAAVSSPPSAPSLLPLTTEATPAPTPPTSRVVVIDPGHGGAEIGAAAHGVVEKESNLEMALRIERLLLEAGVQPVLTRRTDERPGQADAPATPLGFSAQRLDLQARVDLANREQAAIFVSIHSNGSTAAGERGLEVYYNSTRPFAPDSLRLATLLHDAVSTELGAAGFASNPRGVKDDSCLRAFQGRCFPLFVLGPERVTDLNEVLRRGGNAEALGFGLETESIRSRATQMPAALVELLFVTNEQDAVILATEAAREAMARGVVAGVLAYLEGTP